MVRELNSGIGFFNLRSLPKLCSRILLVVKTTVPMHLFLIPPCLHFLSRGPSVTNFPDPSLNFFKPYTPFPVPVVVDKDVKWPRTHRSGIMGGIRRSRLYLCQPACQRDESRGMNRRMSMPKRGGRVMREIHCPTSLCCVFFLCSDECRLEEGGLGNGRLDAFLRLHSSGFLFPFDVYLLPFYLIPA